MAITIRNSELEATIRRIGARTGEGPEAVVSRLVEVEAKANDRLPSALEVKRRMERMQALRRHYAPAQPRVSSAEIEQEVDAIFGDDLR